MKRIALFDTKPYDRRSFDAINKEYGFEIVYYKTHLDAKTSKLTEDCDGVCVFVNDLIDRAVIARLVAQNIGIIALRCAGYNNVDLKAAQDKSVRGTSARLLSARSSRARTITDDDP